MNVGEDTTASNDTGHEEVELFVATDGQLQVTRSNTLDTQILGSVTGQLEHLGSEVLHDGGRVDRCLGSYSHVVGILVLEESVDTTDRELQSLAKHHRESNATCLKSRLGRPRLQNLGLVSALGLSTSCLSTSLVWSHIDTLGRVVWVWIDDVGS